MTKTEHRLATYGTLAPGRVNESMLAGLTGRWLTGIVRGHLKDEGWGAAHGCPGIVLDPDGPSVDVHLFESADLAAHWDRLDAFEGPGYQRIPVDVETPDGPLTAMIYALADSKASAESTSVTPK